MAKIEKSKIHHQLETEKFIDEIDILEYNNDIDNAMKEMDKGEFVLHEKALEILLGKSGLKK